MRTLILILILAAAINCPAQLSQPVKRVRGTFLVSVDDAATIFINGTEAYKAGIGESRSPEIELKTGDRVVVQLRNDGDKRYFMLVFASTDGQTIASFRHRDFKIVPDLGVKDFRAEDFAGWTKFAKEEKRKAALPIKSYSDWVWGDLNKCILACTITQTMFSQKPR